MSHLFADAVEEAEIEDFDLAQVFFNNVVEIGRKTPNKDIIKQSGITLKAHDFLSLVDKQWLNGEIIEAYIKEIAAMTAEKVEVVTTFISALLDIGISKAKHSLRKQIPKLTSDAKIIIPLHLGAHWTLICVRAMSDKVEYFDSLRGMVSKETKEKIDLVCLFLVEIGRIGKDYELEYVADRPFQWNGYDCGMFTMQVARCIILNKAFDFCQPMMPRLRIETGAFLLERRQKIPGNNEYRTPYIFPEMLDDYDEDDMDEDGKDEDDRYEEYDKRVDMINTNTSANEVVVSLSKKIEMVELFDKPYQHPGGRFRPTFLELDRAAPYLDINENGKEYTVNSGGDWKRCLKFTEALEFVGGWEKLEEEIKGNPKVALDWLKNVSMSNDPSKFSFGRRSYYMWVKRLLEKNFHIKVCDVNAEFTRLKNEKKILKRTQRQVRQCNFYLLFGAVLCVGNKYAMSLNMSIICKESFFIAKNMILKFI